MAEVRRQKVSGLEGWKVGGLAKHLNIYTSNLLKKGVGLNIRLVKSHE